MPVEVAIGAALHRVVLKWRKLVDALVERDRQAACGIVFAGKRFGHSGAALFAGIPRIENRVGVFVGPVHGERAAVGEDKDDGLAGGGHRFKQVLFGLGKIDAGAVAAFEAGYAHLHLFAFEFAGDAENSDDDIGILGGFDGLGLRTEIDPWTRPVAAAGLPLSLGE